MDVLWKRNPLSADDVIANVAEDNEWSDATVRSLLNRLLKKKAISAERLGRKYLYQPIIERSDYLQEASSDFLDRLFDGKLAPFVAHFSHNQSLSSDDVQELKRLIESFDDDQ